MNFLILHRHSNLIIKAIASSIKPKDTHTYRFIPISDSALDKYDKLASKRTTLVDIGELIALSDSVAEYLGVNKRTTAKPVRKRRRENRPSSLQKVATHCYIQGGSFAPLQAAYSVASSSKNHHIPA